MSQEHKHVNYMTIFYVLLAMTIAEIGLAMTLQSQKALLIIVLVTLAFIKAGLVAAYFMHLKFERKTFVAIVCFPLILAVVLVVALFPDIGWMHGGQNHHAPAVSAHEAAPGAPNPPPAEHK